MAFQVDEAARSARAGGLRRAKDTLADPWSELSCWARSREARGGPCHSRHARVVGYGGKWLPAVCRGERPAFTLLGKHFAFSELWDGPGRLQLSLGRRGKGG
eukprot:1103606-Rhodomonas_salina.1